MAKLSKCLPFLNKFNFLGADMTISSKLRLATDKLIFLFIFISCVFFGNPCQAQTPTEYMNPNDSTQAGSFSASDHSLPGSPSHSSTIPLRYGNVNAINGDITLKIPLGPTLPGRIPLGFNWMWDGSGAGSGGAVLPVWWPSVDTSGVYIKVDFNGNKLVFLKKATPTQGLPSQNDISNWLNKRHVDTTVVSKFNNGMKIFPNQDGTKFLIISTDSPQSMAIIDNERAIWSSDVTAREGRKTHVTNFWGDHVTIIESTFFTMPTWKLSSNNTGYFRTGDEIPAFPKNVVIKNEKSGQTITLSAEHAGEYCPTNLKITNSLGLPEITSSGFLLGGEREKFNYKSGSGYSTIAYERIYLKIFDFIYMPSFIESRASDGTAQRTNFSWKTLDFDVSSTTSEICGVKNGSRYTSTVLVGPIQTITHEDGLIESFSYTDRINISGNSFNPIEGNWWGYYPSQLAIILSTNAICNISQTSVSSVNSITFSGYGVGQKIIICHRWPEIKATGSSFSNYIWVQPKHETAILYYSSADPGEGDLYRGVRYIHPDGGSWGSPSDRQAFLFATSAIIRSEKIYGHGLPTKNSNSISSALKIPEIYTKYETIDYDHFDFRSWGNPTGALTVGSAGTGPGLPVLPNAMQTSTYKDDFPAEMVHYRGWDTYGPTQVDSYQYESVPAPAPALNTASPMNFTEPVAVSGAAIHKVSKLTRHWRSDLGILLKDGQQESLDGTRLMDLRGVSSVILGSKTSIFDTLGRPETLTHILGSFTAVETRTYEAGLPLVKDTTHSVSDGVVTYPANPDDGSVKVGTSITYDTTSFRWPKTQTDKVDGRPTVFLERDALGRPRRTQAPDGTILATTYDAWGRVYTVKREARSGSSGTVGEVVTTYEYDVPNRTRKETISADGKSLSTTTTLDSLGRVIRVDYPGGKYQETTYDGFGQKTHQSPMMTGSQTPYGVARWEYDEQGRLFASYDPKNRLLSRVIQQPTFGIIIKDGLTLKGVITTVRDDRGFTRSTVTDLLGQKAAVVDQADRVSRYFYDKYGRLIRTDQGGQLRHYAYNDIGWLLSRTEPEEGKTSYGRFSQIGLPTRITLHGRSGNANVLTSTTLDRHLKPIRLTTTAPDTPAVDRQIVYDEAFRVPKSVVEAQTEGVITETYGLDAAGRYLSKSISDGIETFTVSRTLDPLGNTKTTTYPSGGGKPAQTLFVTSDSIFRPYEMYFDGNIRAHMDYDQIEGTSVISKLRLGDPAKSIMTTSRMDQGELTQVVHSYNSGQTVYPITWTPGGLMLSRGSDRFSYDALQRLKQSTTVGLPGTVQAGLEIIQNYEYDRLGNRAINYARVNTGILNNAAPEVKCWSANYGLNNDIPTSLSILDSNGVVQPGSIPTGRNYDDLGRIKTIYAIPGLQESSVSWNYDSLGRVIIENGLTMLLDSEGLRFRRKNTDGSVHYVVYGFNREPLASFEKAPATSSTLKTVATQKSFSHQPKLTSSALNSFSPELPGGSTLAVINMPQNGVTVWTGQSILFLGCDELRPGSQLTWYFGDGQQSVSGSSASHVFIRSGSYTVTLSASAPGCDPSSYSILVNVVARPTINLTAYPNSIINGDPTTLTWAVTGGASTDQKSLTPVPGVVPASGSSVQRPSATTTYTHSVKNAYGTVSASVTVTVNNPPPPTITSFSATTGTLNQGQATTLNWAVTGHPSWPVTLTLRVDAGSTSQTQAVTGTRLSVTPSLTTTYTLIAKNAFGTTTKQITVNVLSKPVVAAFWAEPAVVRPGEKVTLKWQVIDVSSLSIPGIGNVQGGSLVVFPSNSIQYTLNASNAAGTTVSKPVKVTVSIEPATLVWKRSMVYGFGQLVSEETPEGVRYMQSDQVGTPNRILDQNGNIVGVSKNLPFGERFGKTGFSSMHRYTNHEETNDFAIYMQARTYLPAYGKFAQVDPAYDQTKDDPESWNLYNYVTNNPVTHTDPDGREVSGSFEYGQFVHRASGAGADAFAKWKAIDGYNVSWRPGAALSQSGIAPLTPAEQNGTPAKYDRVLDFYNPGTPAKQPGPDQDVVMLARIPVQGIYGLVGDHTGTILQTRGGDYVVQSGPQKGTGLNVADGANQRLAPGQGIAEFAKGGNTTPSNVNIVAKWFVPSGSITEKGMTTLVNQWNDRKIAYYGNTTRPTTTCNTFSRWFVGHLGLQAPNSVPFRMIGWGSSIPGGGF